MPGNSIIFKNNEYAQKLIDQNIYVYFYHKIVNGNFLYNHNFKPISFLFFNFKSIRGLARLLILFFYLITSKKIN